MTATRRTTTLALLLLPAAAALAAVPDSVFARPKGDPRGGGLFLEWSADGQTWSKSLRGKVTTSDYGPWGKGKKLYNPSLAAGEDGLIALVFQVDDKNNQFAVATTRDFVHWRPQDFPYMDGVGQCLSPVITHEEGAYRVVFHNSEGDYYSTTTTDLAHFTPPTPAEAPEAPAAIRLPYSTVERLSDHQRAFAASERDNAELAKDDLKRFDTLPPTVRAEVRVDAARPKRISDKLMGVFFEDINYSADGGLNAELLQNGDFEYSQSDRTNYRKGERRWNMLTAWSMEGDLALDTLQRGISDNNRHAVSLRADASHPEASLRNTGWDGIPVRRGEKYDLSLYTKGGRVKVSIIGGGATLASATLGGARDWKKAAATLIPTADCDSAVLAIHPLSAREETAIDMVSLMPRDTYKGHGLRKDLAETIAALNPKFLRFPGGCLAHGDGLGNIYNWKETIGPVEDRKPLRNMWNYHQSRRIGYYEFFQMCEDMGMEPLPVLAAGVCCANSSVGGNGQQGGIPMDEMEAYAQDVLDLIEWANGDETTEWGRKRIEQGHKKPFGLKMIGIGNEDLISPTFTERYLMLCRAVKDKYPDMEICGTAGPFYYGADYDEGWRVATDNKELIDMVDEHYYLPPGWYVHHQDFYDNYDRSAPKVYLGEWAAHGPGRKSTVETALAEALYYCSLERNADVVRMSSYAPLLAREGHTQWTPDMIYFNGTEVKPTVGYFAHKMCGNSQGDQYLPSTVVTKERTPGVRERIAASAVRNSKTGRTYLKLVNMLPVEVDARLQLEGLLTEGGKTCKTTTLTGNYNSTTARPQEGEARLSQDCRMTLPPYSFTLVEL